MTLPYSFGLSYELPTYAFHPPPELLRAANPIYPVVVIGGGLSGLTLACDLAQRGINTVVLEQGNTVGVRGASSRGICYAQKSLEIMARLGIYDRIRNKGVSWSTGRTYSGTKEIYTFTLPDITSEQPPFINLQQFYVEWYLIDRLHELQKTDIRWMTRVEDIHQEPNYVQLTVTTPQGNYTLRAAYVIDASGANSLIRQKLALPADEAHSTDRWCITDIRIPGSQLGERLTWVDAPFNEGRGVWQHPMGDEVWRVDYQMPPDCDPELIAQPEVALKRLRQQLGPEKPIEFVWIGPYQYRDFLLHQFRHGRLFFIGDAAHVVSPFGARGGNNGIQDAANLAWKLALVMCGKADDSLLDTYHTERHAAAVENLAITRRTARFMAPRSHVEHGLRRAVLSLARDHAFAREFVNTGRMSEANNYPQSAQLPQGGRSISNAVIHSPQGHRITLAELLAGAPRFLILWFDPLESEVSLATRLLENAPVKLIVIGSGPSGWTDVEGQLAAQLSSAAGAAHLIRPDAYLGISLRSATAKQLESALQRALGDATRHIETNTDNTYLNEIHSAHQKKLNDPPTMDADEFYGAWIDAHEGLSTDDSAQFNARLILLLANQINDTRLLRKCIALARDNISNSSANWNSVS